MQRRVLACLLASLLTSAAFAGEGASSLAARAKNAYAQQKFGESADFYAEAIAAGAADAGTIYDAACATALAGRTAAALELLARAVERGMSNVAHLQSDPDLTSLRTTSRFAEIIDAAGKAQARRERFWSSPVISVPYSDALSVDERIAGLSRIWSEARFNFAYFDKIPDLDWDALYMSYLPRVRAASSTAEYYKLLMEFIAQLGDGHTGITPPRELWPQIWAEPPLRVEDVEGHVLVSKVFDPALEGISRGMEILAIEGVPVRQYAAERVAPYQQASTPQDRAARTMRRLLAGDESKPVVLTLVGPNGHTVERTIPRMTQSEEARLVEPLPSFAFRMLPGNVAYVALNEFGTTKAAEQFEAHFDEIAKASALVIDVRLNGGGNSNIGYRVLSALTDKPFKTSKWSTRDYRPAHRAWGRPESTFSEEAGEVPPSGTRLFTNPVVVLTSAKTYSAAEDFMVAFDTMKRGTIIGEATGGSTGQPLMLKLPGGGTARICAKRDTYADGKEFVGTGIQPDLVVKATVKDFRSGRDTVLEAALAFLRK